MKLDKYLEKKETENLFIRLNLEKKEALIKEAKKRGVSLNKLVIAILDYYIENRACF